MQLDKILTNALAGNPGRNTGPRWVVQGTDPRGEHFRVAHFRTRADAVDYRDEVNGNGGNVTVTRAR